MEHHAYFCELARNIAINESAQRSVSRKRKADAMKQVRKFFVGDSEGRSGAVR